MLPPIKKETMPELNFPTVWQAVVYRNFSYVSTDKIAKVLGCDEETVVTEANRLGLFDEYNPMWEKRGYQTIIRNNWYLLPYAQILTLLDISESRLDYILKEEDFFWVKLGFTKPECETVKYQPLTEDQIKETEKIAELTKKIKTGRKTKPFEFFNAGAGFKKVEKKVDGERIVHGFLTSCGDCLMEDSYEYLPDELLEMYQNNGITMLWMHGLLSLLSYYPFKPALCENYEKRRENLNILIERCAKYGIKVALYFNEPRCLPLEDFERFPNLLGGQKDGFGLFCMEVEETRQFLYTAFKQLLDACPGLGAIFTITMSENHTHCNCRGKGYAPDCPRCKDIPAEKSATDINNIIMQAARDSKSDCEIIANIWAWAPYMGWSYDQVERAIELLDKDVSVMCVSECELELEKNGVKNKLIDYSISNPGPSYLSKIAIKKAIETGHKVYAKIQASNSWEMSAVPYLPVFDLVYEHIDNLGKLGVYNHMLSWTLGGYPSINLKLVCDYADKKQDFSLEKWYEENFGEQAQVLSKAVKYFCKGFREFPFSVDCLYNSPKNLGSSNLWSLKPDKKAACMIGYSWDHLEDWASDYPYDKYCEQFTKLLTDWKKGVEILEESNPTGAVKELLLFAKVAYNHFEYDLIHTNYAFYKRDLNKYSKEMKEVIEKARANAYELIDMVYEDGRVGFEASNHYYYTVNNLIEKLINLDKISK